MPGPAPRRRSRRCRNGATDSPGARRRIRITTARSSIVSGMAPIPASAAIANVGMVSRLRAALSQRIAGRLRWCPAFSSYRRSSFASAFFPPKIVSASSTSRVGGESDPIAGYAAAGLAFTVISGRGRAARPELVRGIDRDAQQEGTEPPGAARRAHHPAGVQDRRPAPRGTGRDPRPRDHHPETSGG